MVDTLAQRGPGLASRQRPTVSTATAVRVSAQRGPGLASRQRDQVEQAAAAAAEARSTRAGTRVPATDLRRHGERGRSSSLNEGRDSRPGNGSAHRIRSPRHLRRSTRAGTRVPATGGPSCEYAHIYRCAQRGPGLASRQRGPDGRVATVRPGPRSTRAGTRVPATGGVPHPDLRLAVRSTRAGTRVPATGAGQEPRLRQAAPRSTRAGTRVPATVEGEGFAGRVDDHAQRGPGLASRQRRTCGRCWPRRSSPLNEGRDSRPGNGGDVGLGASPEDERSTRAGTRVPATGAQHPQPVTLPQHRSTRAGTRVPATERRSPPRR